MVLSFYLKNQVLYHQFLLYLLQDEYKKQGGQAMGLNVFALFTGFGIGSLIFGELLKLGLDQALIIFAGVQVVFTIVAAQLLKTEIKLSTK